MSDAIHWILQLEIKEGHYDEFMALMAEMVEATQANEPDATHYEWYVSEDRKNCHIYERYTDSAAVMTHLGNFGSKFADRFLALLDPKKLTVYGNPSEQVRAALATLGAIHLELAGGYAR